MAIESPVIALAEKVRAIVERAVPGSGNLYDEVVTAAQKPLIETVLEQARGNRMRAAEMLGVSRNTLARLMRRHEIAIVDREVRAAPSRFKTGGFSFDYRSQP